MGGRGEEGVLKTSRKRQPEECGVDRSRLPFIGISRGAEVMEGVEVAHE